MKKRKSRIDEQKSTEEQIREIHLDIDTLLSGIRNDITTPLHNLVHVEEQLSTQTDDVNINGLCMKVQTAVDKFSQYTYPHYNDITEIAEEKEKLFTSVNERIAEPLHEITRSVGQLAYTASDEGIVKDAEKTEAYAKFLEYNLRDIFDTISIRRDEFTLNERRFHLSELISEITFIAEHIAEEKELAFECLSDPDTPEFWVGDDIRVRQAVLDICNASISHTTDGLVRLYVSSNNDGGLTFVVSDTSNGTDGAAEESIGMKLTNSLGGAVRTESVRGRGSEFIIDFPLNEGRQIADADGLLDIEEGFSYYDNDADEYRQVLMLFTDTAPSYRDSIMNDPEGITDITKSLYRASRSIGARALSERLLYAINDGSIDDDFTEIFDETMYRVAGYAGRR